MSTNFRIFRWVGLAAAIAMSAGVGCGASGSSNQGAGGMNAGGASGTGTGGSLALDSGGGAFEGCATEVYGGELVPLDMFIMLDRSGSMSEAGKWGAVTTALGSFLGLPESEGIGVGLGFFPKAPSVPPPTTCMVDPPDCGNYGPCLFNSCLGAITGDSCEFTDYQAPDVPIANLPANAGALSAAIAGTGPNGGTPTDAALHGAITHASAWAQANPARLVLVVLATDGEPSGCNPNTIDTVSARARVGFEANPSVQTFVIGVGGSLTSLDMIAASGGTDKAVIVSGSGNTGQEFLDALNVVRGATSCKFQIPLPPTGTPDPALVNVGWTPEGGKQEAVPRVDNATHCMGMAGWYYDDNANPNRILLCPASCDVVEHTKGEVAVVLGCESVVN